MKNKGIKLLTLILALVSFCLFFTGCLINSSLTNKYSVTFKQDGFADVVVYVDKGGSLSEDQIPTPQPKSGYKIVWEDVDFSNIDSDIVVNAIETYIPVNYTITLIYDIEGIDLTGLPTTITVRFNDKISLPKYSSKSNSGYSIEYWTYEDGTKFTKTHYDIEGDITLKAKWQWFG